jgi:hypothetical protein
VLQQAAAQQGIAGIGAEQPRHARELCFQKLYRFLSLKRARTAVRAAFRGHDDPIENNAAQAHLWRGFVERADATDGFIQRKRFRRGHQQDFCLL